jgi:phosphopentomutase/2,3-bisphosphoglycerate-independent phosphoglycerate mutase family metalloenzyme
LKQYPPVSFAALLVVVLTLPACVDHGQSHLAFASSGPLDDLPMPGPAPGQPAVDPAAGGRIVLVTIDGVRAEDVFDGADPSLRPDSNVEKYRTPEAVMPRTYQLVATRGVALGADRHGCGAVHTASGANVSLPGYLEIYTGRRTRCRDNTCDRTTSPTVLDEAVHGGIAPVASIGSWEILDHAVSNGSMPSMLVAEGTQRWPEPRPLGDAALEQLVYTGERAEAYPGHGRYRPDASTMAIALEYLRTAEPAILHVGLGDPDEYGHRNDYPAYLAAIGEADAFIGKVADTLDAMGDLGARTTVIVTTDHGRNRNFQHHGAYSLTSARTFVLAFGAKVAARGVACPVRDVTLADIAPTIRVLTGLPADPSRESGRPIEEIVGVGASEAAVVARAAP